LPSPPESFTRPTRKNPLVAASVESADSTTITLSPFEVVSGQDVGYRAQNTLGGTRLNTSLKDTAASLSVMIAEFLADVAATNQPRSQRSDHPRPRRPPAQLPKNRRGPLARLRPQPGSFVLTLIFQKKEKTGGTPRPASPSTRCWVNCA